MSLVKSDVTLLYINKTDLQPINILFFFTVHHLAVQRTLQFAIFYFFLSDTDHSLIIGRGMAQTERSQEPERNLDPSTDVNQSTLPLQPMSLALLQSTVPYMSLVMPCPYITCCLKKKKTLACSQGDQQKEQGGKTQQKRVCSVQPQQSLGAPHKSCRQKANQQATPPSCAICRSLTEGYKCTDKPLQQIYSV